MSKQLKNGLFIRPVRIEGSALGLKEVELNHIQVILRCSVAFQFLDYFNYLSYLRSVHCPFTTPKNQKQL